MATVTQRFLKLWRSQRAWKTASTCTSEPERADPISGSSTAAEELAEAFGGVLGENLTTTQLIHLFMKIDANSDGSVDWDEFTQFMLLENQAAADMSDRSFAVRYMEQDPRLCDPNPKSVHH